MKKVLATLLALVMLVGTSISAYAYNGDPTSYSYNYNNYGYSGYNYNNYGYGYGYGYCTGVREDYSDNEYDNDPWFDSYADEYGVVFHLPPNMPITRSDVFAPVGKAMYQAYEDAGRRFTSSYGVNFIDFTWDRSLYEIAGGLYQRGIMIGYPEDNTVRFANYINRAEFAKVVVLMARENGLTSYNNMTMSYEFPDMKDNWASEYASQCQALGLLIGRDGEVFNPETGRYERAYLFDPNANVTYQEYVTVMLRMSEMANRSNYSVEFEDIAYGISTTMDIDFEGYEFDEDFDLSVSGSKTVYMTVGQTKELKVKATPSDIELSKSDVEWEASKSNYVKLSNKQIEDDRYAIVTIKALKEGKLTVTATSRKDDDVSVEFNIVISEDEEDDEDDNVYVTSIVLNPTAVNLKIGETESITATIKPSNATDKGVSWKSHNTNVATVNQNGKITAVGVGNTTVTATADDGSGVVATIDVTVTAKESQETTVIDTEPPIVEVLTDMSNIKKGDTGYFDVVAHDDNLSSLKVYKSSILGITQVGIEITKTETVADNTVRVYWVAKETCAGEFSISAGAAIDKAGNKSAESLGVYVCVNPAD